MPEEERAEAKRLELAIMDVLPLVLLHDAPWFSNAARALARELHERGVRKVA